MRGIKSTWEYIESLVDKSNATAYEGCWLWTGNLNCDGYGSLTFQGRKTFIHILMYEHYVGKIPDGLELDHWCKVRHCCRPGHLEAVTHAENMARGAYASKTHCKRGHEFNVENTYIRGNGRACKVCQNDYYLCNKEKIANQMHNRYLKRKIT